MYILKPCTQTPKISSLINTHYINACLSHSMFTICVSKDYFQSIPLLSSLS